MNDANQNEILTRIEELRNDLEHLRDEVRHHEIRLKRFEEREAGLLREGIPVFPMGPSRPEIPPPPPPPPPPSFIGEDIRDILERAKRAGGEHADWEALIGGNLLTKVGAAALVVGVGFFIKYAFDNQWVGETARIILGIITGMVLMG